jgi:hypothetical protein
MSDSRRTSLPPQPSAPRVLSLEGQTADLVVAPVDWLDYFPAEFAAEVDKAVALEAVTFVVEPVTSITEPRQKSRSSHRRRLRHGWGGLLQRQQQRVVAARLRLSTSLRRVVFAAVSYGRGVWRFFIALVAAVAQVGIRTVLLPWRLLTAGVAAVRAAFVIATRSARNGWRYTCAISSALWCGVVASVTGAVHGVRRTVQVIFRSAVSLIMATTRAVVWAVVATMVTGAGLVYSALLTAARTVHAGAVFVRDVSVRAGDYGIGAVRRAGASMRLGVIGVLRFMATRAENLGHAARTLAQSLRAAALRLQEAAYSLAHHALTSLRSAVCHSIAVVRRASASMRLAVVGLLRFMATGAENLGHATRTLAQSLRAATVRMVEAIYRVAHYGMSSLRAGGRKLHTSGARVGHVTSLFAHGVRTGSGALESRIRTAAREGAQAARRHANSALIGFRAAETSAVAGAARLYHDKFVDLGRMRNTVVVIRVPANLRDRHQLGRRPVLAAAGALFTLVLIVAVTRVDNARQSIPSLLFGQSVIGAGGAEQAALPPVPAAALTAVVALAPAIQQRDPTVTPDTQGIALSRNDRRAIQAVLNRYRDALSVLNVGAVTTVWPGANADAVRAAFANVVEQNVEFERCRIAPRGFAARADCAGVIESGFSAGQRRPKVERTRWEFTLQKRGNYWMITAVDMLPG